MGYQMYTEMQKALEPLMPTLNNWCSEHPDTAKRLRLARCLSLADGAWDCVAIHEHAPCVEECLTLHEILTMVLTIQPETFDAIYEGFKAMIQEHYPGVILSEYEDNA